MTPDEYCRGKATPAGSSLYYSTLFHDHLEKRKLHALFALLQELNDTVIECQDPGVARIKLEWWREEITRLFSVEARQPVSKALQNLMPDIKLDHIKLLNLVDAVESEINPTQAESLQQHIEQFSSGRGTTWHMAAQSCNCQDSRTIAQVEKIGGLNSSLEFLQLARQQINRGYCPYPRLEMEKHGLNHQSLLQQDILPALTNLQTELFTSIESQLADNILALSNKDCRTVLFALSMARIAEATCTLLQKQAAGIPAQALSLTPLRKLWIAWRTKREICK
jgi:15-cis-phytoene synthase